MLYKRVCDTNNDWWIAKNLKIKTFPCHCVFFLLQTLLMTLFFQLQRNPVKPTGSTHLISGISSREFSLRRNFSFSSVKFTSKLRSCFTFSFFLLVFGCFCLIPYKIIRYTIQITEPKCNVRHLNKIANNQWWFICSRWTLLIPDMQGFIWLFGYYEGFLFNNWEVTSLNLVHLLVVCSSY